MKMALVIGLSSDVCLHTLFAPAAGVLLALTFSLGTRATAHMYAKKKMQPLAGHRVSPDRVGYV